MAEEELDQTYPERSRVGNPNRQVGKDSKHAVRKWRLEGQVVRDLMNSQEEVLVGGCANDVGRQKRLPRPEGRVAQSVGAEELQADNAEDDEEGQGLGAAEFQDL